METVAGYDVARKILTSGGHQAIAMVSFGATLNHENRSAIVDLGT